MIKALRIDHRLMHGQVAFSWAHYLGVDRIIIIDDKVANDDFQKMVLNMAKPAGIKLSIFSVDVANDNMEKINQLNDSIFIIFGCAENASRFILSNPQFSELNLGGIAKKDGSRKYSEVVYLTDSEEEDLRKVEKLGVKLCMQQLPTSTKENLTLI
jgi:PTS system mannose-specific IIB component